MVCCQRHWHGIRRLCHLRADSVCSKAEARATKKDLGRKHVCRWFVVRQPGLSCTHLTSRTPTDKICGSSEFIVTIYRFIWMQVYLHSSDPTGKQFHSIDTTRQVLECVFSFHVADTHCLPTADGVPFLVSSAVELNMAVICACMPNIRGLLANIFPKHGSTWSGGSNPNKTWPAKMTPEPHSWDNSEQSSNDSRTVVSGGIRVTHMTSVTSTEDQDNVFMGSYYPLNDLSSCQPSLEWSIESYGRQARSE